MTVNYKNTPIAYQTYGHGEPMVLLHGFLESSLVWNDFIPWLSKKHQVITIDLFGHGKTPVHGDISTMETMADMVHTVLNALKRDAVNLIGHSMGGYVTMAYLEQFPGETKRALLLNSSPKPDGEDRRKERDQVIKIAKKHKDVLVKMGVQRLFAPTNLEKFSPKIDALIEEAQQMTPEAIIAASKGMKQRKDRTAILKDFEGVKWIIAGKEDALIPLQSLEKVAEETQTHLKTLPDGHMSYIEQQKEVERLLDRFLKA